jgi:hypothetical protein
MRHARYFDEMLGSFGGPRCLQFIRLMTLMWIVPAEMWGDINWKMEVCAAFHQCSERSSAGVRWTCPASILAGHPGLGFFRHDAPKRS